MSTDTATVVHGGRNCPVTNMVGKLTHERMGLAATLKAVTLSNFCTRMEVNGMNKFLYMKVVQGNFGYGDGWEDLCMSASLKGAYHDLNEYIKSGHSGSFRIVNRRVSNPEYARGGDKNA